MRDKAPDESDEEDFSSLPDILRDLTTDKDVVKSVADWISAAAKNKACEPSLARHSLYLGYFFGCVIFFGIGALGWEHVISGEATTGLLGSLVGYWFGQRQRK